jgi:hypothetical protein
MSKDKKPAKPEKPTVTRKAARRRNGVPMCNPKSRDRAYAKLMARPLYESARVNRMVRKLGLAPRPSSGIKD